MSPITPRRSSASLLFLLGTVLVVLPTRASAQITQPGVDSSVAARARRTAAAYKDADPDRYLDNLARLEIVAGDYLRAAASLRELREARLRAGQQKAVVALIPYETYVSAKLSSAANHVSFADALRQSFTSAIRALDDRTAAYELNWALGTSLPALENGLSRALANRRPGDTVSIADDVDLVRRYAAVTVYRSVIPLALQLQAEDDRRRYFIAENVLVPTPDGAHICVLVMRPRNGPGRLPALLNFTIYENRDHTDEARLSASRGYAGVYALSRGKGCSPDAPVPFEHDGSDASAVIGWIARQPWSDGRVGMFGGSYDGFTQWAALKHHPPALKAIMPSVTADPGLGFPMEGGVFMNYAYPYPFYVTDHKGLDDAVYYDSDRWDRLNHAWYTSGRAYADLSAIDGAPNPIFARWLAHPSYDSYWQAMMPYAREFAAIKIPVLTTTGYYDSGQEGALYFFLQHSKYDPAADHYLVIGPYDHIRGQRGTISPLGSRLTTLRGYALDSVAQIELPGELRYAWFDYVFKGAAKPALLRDRVNYEVMGANVWKHAPSVDAMAARKMKLYLDSQASPPGSGHSLRGVSRGGSVDQVVNLADRSDVAAPNIDQALDDWSIIDVAPRIGNAVSYVSDPFTSPLEVSGRFSGSLDFITNKKDFDLSVTLFELTPGGRYFQLSYFWIRASYATDRTHRHLLSPGVREHLDFESARLTSRLFERGSRLVVVLGIIKQPGEQINYGTGKDVSRETIADAKDPLRIRWLNRSYVAVPIGRR